MSDLSSVQTTSFHTRLSFLDEENDDSLLEDEEDGEEYGEEYNKCGPSGTVVSDGQSVCVSFSHIWFIKVKL